MMQCLQTMMTCKNNVKTAHVPCHWISHPVLSLNGVMTVPGDKSISHRALFLSALAEGVTLIEGFSDGDDCVNTWCALEAMGVHIERVARRVVVHGVGKHGLSQPTHALNCGNSGTSMRLLMGLLAAQSFDTQLVGDESLHRRPMERVARPLHQMGARLSTSAGKAPIWIRGGACLHGITYDMPEASAQVKTALFLAGLYARGRTRIIEQIPTRDHTERMLTAFSYPVCLMNRELIIDASYALKGTTVRIPGDLSAAAFFIVAATLIPGSQLTINHVGVNPTRLGVLHLLKAMGACIVMSNQHRLNEEPVASLHIRYAPLHGITIPAAMIPLAIDEFPILFIAAACASGVTRLYGGHELRYKESDRIGVMVEGLGRLGIEAYAHEDGVSIHGGQIKGGVVSSGFDHRVAMAFAIAGAVASAPVKVLNCGVVSTSFPGFMQTANQIKLSIERADDE